MFFAFEVRFPAPSRGVKQLKFLRGDLAVVMPSNMLTFTFNKLAKITMPTQARRQAKGGVTVSLARLNPDEDPWDVEIRLKYPKSGPRFESYQSCVVYKEAYLEH